MLYKCKCKEWERSKFLYCIHLYQLKKKKGVKHGYYKPWLYYEALQNVNFV